MTVNRKKHVLKKKKKLGGQREGESERLGKCKLNLSRGQSLEVNTRCWTQWRACAELISLMKQKHILSSAQTPIAAS